MNELLQFNYSLEITFHYSVFKYSSTALKPFVENFCYFGYDNYIKCTSTAIIIILWKLLFIIDLRILYLHCVLNYSMQPHNCLYLVNYRL